MQLNNTIIYLIGFAGVGKFTIAKELAKLDEFRIVDNQLINNPVFNVVEAEEGAFPLYVWRQIRKIREVVFETIKHYSPDDMNFIFTNELFEGQKGELPLYKQVEEIVKSRESQFFPVRLLVDKEQHRKRLTSPDRKEKLKVTDEAHLDRIDGFEVLKPNHQNLINLDTTKLSALQSAEHILNKIKEIKCQ